MAEVNPCIGDVIYQLIAKELARLGILQHQVKAMLHENVFTGIYGTFCWAAPS